MAISPFEESLRRRNLRSPFAMPEDVALTNAGITQPQIFQPRNVEAEATVDNRSPGERYYEESNRLRSTHPLLDQYNQKLGEAPTRDQYKPSFGRRLAAGLIGGAMTYATRDPRQGLSMVDRINDQKYNDATERYDTEIGQLGRGAALERQSIDDQMGTLSNAYKFGLDYDKYRSDAENDAAKTEIDRQRAKAYADRQSRPEFAPFDYMGGTMFYNKADPTDRSIFNITSPEAQRSADYGRSVTNTDRNQRGNLALGQQRLGFDREKQAADEGFRWSNLNQNMDLKNRTLDSLVNDRKTKNDLARERLQSTTFGNPLNRSRAYDQALQELMADPDYAEFIEETDPSDPSPYRIREDISPEDFQDLMGILEMRTSSYSKPERTGR